MYSTDTISPRCSEQDAWLDRVDRRYNWLKRHLIEFEERLGPVCAAPDRAGTVLRPAGVPARLGDVGAAGGGVLQGDARGAGKAAPGQAVRGKVVSIP